MRKCEFSYENLSVKCYFLLVEQTLVKTLLLINLYFTILIVKIKHNEHGISKFQFKMCVFKEIMDDPVHCTLSAAVLAGNENYVGK